MSKLSGPARLSKISASQLPLLSLRASGRIMLMASVLLLRDCQDVMQPAETSFKKTTVFIVVSNIHITYKLNIAQSEFMVINLFNSFKDGVSLAYRRVMPVNQKHASRRRFGSKGAPRAFWRK